MSTVAAVQQARPQNAAWINAAKYPELERRTNALFYCFESHWRVRSHFGLQPDHDALRRLAQRFHMPEWVTGSIAMGEAMFLFDMVLALRPERVIEIGVASGCSTAAMLIGLQEAGIPARHPDGGAVLHAFDTLDHCYFAPEKTLAAAALEMVPDLRDALSLHTPATAGDAAERFAGHKLPLVFIDANHRHPHPTADVLTLAPIVKPGGWFILHDIALPEVARRYEATTGEKVTWNAKGAQVLFENWPFEKLRGGHGCANIGAIRMPEDHDLTADHLAEIIDIEWEVTPSKGVQRVLDRA